MKVFAPKEPEISGLDEEMGEFYRRSVKANTATGLPKEFKVQTELQQFDTTMRPEDEVVEQKRIVQQSTLAPPKPTVTQIYGNNGGVFGGTTRGIRGTNFTPSSKVFFKDRAATNVQVFDDTYIACTVPALSPVPGPATDADIDVFNIPNDTNFRGRLANGFHYYIAPKPVSISPTTGPAAGGTAFTVTAVTNSILFGSGYVARFGGIQVPVTVSGSSWVGVTPAFPGATGTVVSVQIVAPDFEAQSGTLVNAFTFGTPPPPPSPDPPLGFLWAGPGFGLGFGFFQGQWAYVNVKAINSVGGFYSTYNGTVKLFVSYQGADVTGIEAGNVDVNAIPISNGEATFLMRAINIHTYPPSSVDSFRLLVRDNAHPGVQTESPSFAISNTYG